MNYYNDNDAFAAQWLRNLIAAGHLPPGDVDERSIDDVQPSDLDGYQQAHFFAGIGGWPLALRLAGWPDDQPVWTGSCPCQPLSSAGNRQGQADSRHLWPAFHRLIAKCRPPVVFGEQVAGPLGREWLAAVRLDMEDAGYAVGAADLASASVGAPHIRQRLYWVADANRKGRHRQEVPVRQGSPRPTSPIERGPARGVADANQRGRQRAQVSVRQSRPGEATAEQRRPSCRMANSERGTAKRQRLDVAKTPRGASGEVREQRLRDDAGAGSHSRAMDDAEGSGCDRRKVTGDDTGDASERAWGSKSPRTSATSELGDAESLRRQESDALDRGGTPSGRETERAERSRHDRIPDKVLADSSSGAHWNSRQPWAAAEAIQCTDGKSRLVEPGVFPLAHGVPARVGRLRAYGNAIVPQVGSAFVTAYLESKAIQP